MFEHQSITCWLVTWVRNVLQLQIAFDWFVGGMPWFFSLKHLSAPYFWCGTFYPETETLETHIFRMEWEWRCQWIWVASLKFFFCFLPTNLRHCKDWGFHRRILRSHMLSLLKWYSRLWDSADLHGTLLFWHLRVVRAPRTTFFPRRWFRLDFFFSAKPIKKQNLQFCEIWICSAPATESPKKKKYAWNSVLWSQSDKKRTAMELWEASIFSDQFD